MGTGRLGRFLAFALLVVVPQAQGRDYFVSPAGSNQAPGTKDQPWRSVERVNALDLQPGDRVLFQGGNTFPGNLALDQNDSGTAEKKVVLSSYGSGRAIVDAGNGHGLVATGCSHLLISNLVFRGSGRNAGSEGSGIKLSGGKDLEVGQVEVSGFRLDGVLVSNVENTRITRVHAHDNGHAGIASGRPGPSVKLYIGYCTTNNNPGDPKNLDNHSGNGIVIGWAEDVLVEYCRSFNNGWDMTREGNGPVGIWTFNTKNIVIQHCVSHDNRSPGDDGGGFDIDGGTENCVLQYNLSYNNDGPGYFLCQYPTAPPLKNNIIRYNLSHNDGRKNNRRSGIDIFAAEPNASGCEIYNNTVYNQYGPAVGFGGYHIPGVVFRNNIFVAATQPIAGDYSAARFVGNLWWTLESSNFAVGKYKSFQQWSEATGQEKLDDRTLGIFADPRLANVAPIVDDDPERLRQVTSLQLAADSPCLGAGTAFPGSGGQDFWGNPVVPDRPPSLGAHEPLLETVDASPVDPTQPIPR